MEQRHTRALGLKSEPIPEGAAAVIDRVWFTLDAAVVKGNLYPMTKADVVQKAFPKDDFEYYVECGGKVRAYGQLKRHFTQVIALRDAVWAADRSNDRDKHRKMQNKLDDHMTKVRKFLERGWFED
jgi:hypothetical protein